MGNDHEEAPESPEVDFEPVMKLPLVETKTLEEDEEELVKLRAKLFRYDSSKETSAEWKERGTGEVKILRHKEHETVRIVMRRDKTLKICANHYVQPFMEMDFKSGSDKALVWSTPADYADEEPKPELLAIKFATAENCLKFKEAFEKGLQLVSKKKDADTSASADEQESSLDSGNADDTITKEIQKLSLGQEKSIESGDNSLDSKSKETLQEETSNSLSSSSENGATKEK